MKHDDMCPGCDYERRREVNGVGVRMKPDYRATCSECGAEILGEMEHRINGQTYCPPCTVNKTASPATH